jgi:hypothetical protein
MPKINDWKIRRFVVFCGDAYSPGMGWDSYRGSFPTLGEAKACVAEWIAAHPGNEDRQIIDLSTGEDADD